MSSGSYMPVGSATERTFARAALFLAELAHRRPCPSSGELVQQSLMRFPTLAKDEEMLLELRLLAELIPSMLGVPCSEETTSAIHAFERDILRHVGGDVDREASGRGTRSGGGTVGPEGQSAARAAKSAPVRQVGNVVILRRYSPLGSGLNNRVYYGVDVEQVRLVAVKILDTELASLTGLERFKNEIRLLSKLKHPGVVRLLDWGRLGSVWYFVMDLVEGTTLADRRLPHWQSKREAVRLMIEVAESAHAFHLQGIVHRDLKPSNLLLDEHGHVTIADFGLAWGLSEPNMELTLVGQLLGTPAYMAPEQISTTSRVGMTADIHAIGAMLYHFTTGRLPFVGRSLAESLWLLETAPAKRPTEIDVSYPPELEVIVLKCLAKNPQDRYRNCPELVRDLEGWLEVDRDDRAFWPAYGRRWARAAVGFLRRHPRLWLWGALVCLGLASILPWQNHRASSDPPFPAAALDAVGSFWNADPLGAFEHARRSQRGELDGASPWVLGVLGDGVLNAPLAQIKAHTGDAYEIALGPDGRFLASTGKDGATRLWRVRDGELVGELSAGGPETNGICFDDRGTMVFWADDAGSVHGWSVAERRRLWETRISDEAVFPLVWLREQQRVVAGTQGGKLVVLGRGGRVKRVVDVESPVQTLDIRPTDGRVLVTCDEHIWLWRPGGDELQLVETPGREEKFVVARTVAGEQMAMGVSSGRVRFEDPEQGISVDLAGWHGRAVTALSAGMDNELLTAGREGTVWVRDLRLGVLKAAFVHPGRVWDIAYLSAKDLVFTTCADGVIRVWDLDAARVLRVRRVPDAISARVVSDDGGIWMSGWGGLRHIPIERLWAASPGPGRIAAHWVFGDVTSARWVDQYANLHRHSQRAASLNGLAIRTGSEATDVAASAGGVVYAYGQDAELVVECGSGERRFRVLRDPLSDVIGQVLVSPNGRQVYWRSNARVGVIDVVAGRIAAWRDTRSRPTKIELSGTGRYLAVGYANGPVEILDGYDLHSHCYVAATDRAVCALAFAPEESLLAVHYENGLLCVVETAGGRRLVGLQMGAPVGKFVAHDLCFSTDGTVLLCVGKYFSARGRPVTGLLVALGAARDAAEVRARFRHQGRRRGND